MKKKIIGLCIAAVLGAASFAACTPSAESAWVADYQGANFNISYTFVKNIYDGSTRTVTVKDSTAFEEYLTTVEGYCGGMQKVDSTDEVFVYTADGSKFYIENIGEGQYFMSACLYTLYFDKSDDGSTESISFVFPPVTYTPGYYNYGETYVQVIQNWDYFYNFYSDYQSAVIDSAEQTITVSGGNKAEGKQTAEVTLKYENYVVYFSFETLEDTNGES